MSLVLHMVWLGGTMPLRSLNNLARIARLYAAELPLASASVPADKPYFPLLWLDDGALDRLLRDAAIPTHPAAPEEVPPVLRQAAQESLGTCHAQCQWLLLERDNEPSYLPFVIYEAMRPHLLAAWQDNSEALDHLNGLRRRAPGFLRQEIIGADSAEGLARLFDQIDGITLVRYFNKLAEHARACWSHHGLLCRASDILRLQALVLLPGAYIDLGDVAGLLTRLPSINRVRTRDSSFCGHQTVAIENDVIFCSDASLMKAIVYGSYLWSVQTMRAAAQRLGRNTDYASPLELADDLLPVFDQKMPRLPDLHDLFKAPFAKLADYISVAYGSSPVFGNDAAVNPVLGGRNVKELLINNVAGFTGYQKFAHYLAPRSPQTWAQCENDFGLRGYAPQMGWRVHGFGLIDGLIYCGRCLDGSIATRAGVDRETRRYAGLLDLQPPFVEDLARFCVRTHDLLAAAHFNPSMRQRNHDEVLALAAALAA